MIATFIMKKQLVISLKIFLLFTILTGIAYPLIVTGIVQSLFPWKANGSMVLKNGEKIGSKLIGQNFDSIVYFSSRPSAIAYNPLPSGGSNYGLANPKLKSLVAEREKQFMAFNGLDSLATTPPEMLFASASGVDPHISVEAARLQVNRIANARHFDAVRKQKLVNRIESLAENPQYMIFGEKRVNVLLLNLELDKL
jgi:potassium-transporting ATPase KdpC subunit